MDTKIVTYSLLTRCVMGVIGFIQYLLAILFMSLLLVAIYMAIFLEALASAFGSSTIDDPSLDLMAVVLVGFVFASIWIFASCLLVCSPGKKSIVISIIYWTFLLLVSLLDGSTPEMVLEVPSVIALIYVYKQYHMG